MKAVMRGRNGPPADRLLGLLREYRALELQRTTEGVTPLEYMRWIDLRDRMARTVRGSGPPEDPEKSKVTRLLVEFNRPESLARAQIGNVTRGGLFVSTPFGPEIGTRLILRVRIESTGDELVLPGEVVSNNVGDGFSTSELGFGVRFDRLPAALKGRLDALLDRGGADPSPQPGAAKRQTPRAAAQSARSSTSSRRQRRKPTFS